MAQDLAPWLAAQGLTQSDLDANRRGRISEPQAAKYRAKMEGIFSFLACLSAAGIAMGVLRALGRSRPAEDHSLFVGIAVGSGLALILLTIAGVALAGIRRKLADGTVLCVTGEVVSRFESSGWVRLSFDGVTYLAIDALGPLVGPGVSVRLYVLPGSTRVIAAEPGN